jgi:hypothetical protein
VNEAADHRLISNTAPPQRVGEAPAQPSIWPVVLSVIGLSFSAFGALGGCITASTPWLLDAISKMMPAEDRGDLAVVEQWQWWIVADALVWLLLSIAMIVACLKLIKRRPSSRAWIMCWAWLKIAYSIGDSVLSYAMAAWAVEHSEDMADAPAGFLGIVGIGGAALNFAFYAALPVFMLIWFSRRKIKNEMAGWAR